MSTTDTRLDATLYRPEEVATQLSLHRETIMKWVRSGKLGSIRLGPKSYRIRQEDIDQLLADGIRS